MKKGKMAWIFLLALFFSTSQVHHASASQRSANDILLDGTSPYEDLIEYALAGNGIEVARSVQSLEKSGSRLFEILPESAGKKLKSNITKIIEAEKPKEYSTIALYAMDSFEVIVSALDVSESDTSAQLAAFDILGFKVHVLLKQKTVDWSLLEDTVKDGNRRWQAIRKNVAKQSLKDTMDTTMEGLSNALQSKNTEMLNFAAQVDLDLVDLLEEYFEDRK